LTSALRLALRLIVAKASAIQKGFEASASACLRSYGVERGGHLPAGLFDFGQSA
jgi:hypothetical protein